MAITEKDLAELLTLDQAAEFYQCSRSTIERMIANHEIEVVRLGSGRGRPRIRKRALLDHMNRNVTPVAKDRRRTSA